MTVAVCVEDFKQVGTAARQHGSVRQHLVSTHLYVKHKQEAHVLVRIFCLPLHFHNMKAYSGKCPSSIFKINSLQLKAGITSLKVHPIWVFLVCIFQKNGLLKSHISQSMKQQLHVV